MDKDEKMQLKNHTFDPEVARLNLAYMIVMHEYPLRMVEHKWFRVFVGTLHPHFKPISRNTLRTDIMKIFCEEKKKIMDILEDNKSRIAITTDMWTSSNQKKGYMAITAHYIDNSWRLQSRIVRFVYVPYPHTAEVITHVLVECLLDWNIDLASEAAFSTSGRVVNKHRSRLIPETLEALMCSQDWLWERLDVQALSSSFGVANGVTAYSSDEENDEDSTVTTLY